MCVENGHKMIHFQVIMGPKIGQYNDDDNNDNDDNDKNNDNDVVSWYVHRSGFFDA